MSEASVEISQEELDTEFHNAKAYLLKTSTHSSLNVFDNLSSILTKLLKEKPENAADIIEDLLRDSKRSTFKPSFDTIQDQQDDSTEVLLARSQQTLFEQKADLSYLEPEGELDEEHESPLPDLMELANYFEQAGVGLSREETFRIFLALKQLVDSNPIRSCRFWGKILGLQANYIIAEVEFHEGEDPMDVEEEEHIEGHTEKEDGHPDGAPDIIKEGDFDVEEDDVPRTEFKPPPLIPTEENRIGCNKKAYFVCNEAGKPWVRLPQVTPAQVVVARQIKKFFTGNLDLPVVSYPPFPGNEAEYLRAQISRISSTTHVSPLGYYMFEEEEEEEDEGAVRDTFVVNQEFEGLAINDMVEPTCANWVHHVQYILPQGRCSWYNPSQKRSEEEELEEEEEDEEREEPDEPEPETGPPLLTPLSEDSEVDGMPPWTANKSSALVPQYSIGSIHSNLWPGAHAFAVERKFENIYIGYGQKYMADNYSPPPPPTPQEEYPSGPEITEADDPTVEEEKALKAAQQEALEAQEMEEEEEDDEEDDD